MYVCICNGVTESDIAKAVRNGARTLDCLTATLNVSNNCGQCRCVVDDCLKSALESHREPVREDFDLEANLSFAT